MPWIIFTDTVRKTEDRVQGSYQENDIHIQPRLTKNWKHFTISPYLSIYNSKREPSYSETFYDTTIITERNSYYTSQTTETKDSLLKPTNSLMKQVGAGLTFYFNFKFITIGNDLKVITNNDKSDFFFSPFLKVDITEKIHLSTYYFRKKNYVVSLSEGSQLINSLDQINRFNLTGEIDISKKLNFYKIGRAHV